MSLFPEGESNHEQILSEEELSKEAANLWESYERVLSSIPEFQEAAVEGYWNSDHMLDFTKGGKTYNVRPNFGPLVSRLLVRRRTPDNKVDREVIIDRMRVGDGEVTSWLSDWKDYQDMQYTPHFAKNTQKAVKGACMFLAELEALAISS